MEISIQAKTDGVAFRRPVFQRQFRRFLIRLARRLENYGRVKAARSLARHGHYDVAKNLLEGQWK